MKRNESEEAYAYTPGLKVKRSMRVAKTRRLPIHGEVTVNVGDTVKYDTIVATTHVSGEPQVLDASTMLGIEPDELTTRLVKKVGDRVAKDEAIAISYAFGQFFKKQVTSPIEGTIDSVSDTTGQVVVRGLPIPVNMKAYIPGRIVEVLPREGAVIETNAAFIQGIFGVGGETHGQIRVTVDSSDKELTDDMITQADNGAVLIGGSLANLKTLRKAAEIGVSCIVTGGIEYRDVSAFIGKAIGVAITGEEEVGLTVIATEGFGKMKMSARTFDLLAHYEGHVACCNGATQIRAGVLRPEIVIPHEEKLEAVIDDKLSLGIMPGTPVRIIRQPYFGVVGKVGALPVDLKQVESESHVRILTVELDDGRILSVPRANIEIIEE